MADFPILDLTRDDIALRADWPDDRIVAAFLSAVHRADAERRATRVTDDDGRVIAVVVPGRAGPDLLDATGRGDTLPEMRAIAMAKARKLYGDDAELRVEDAGRVRSYGTGFTCVFTIRCLNFPREAL